MKFIPSYLEYIEIIFDAVFLIDNVRNPNPSLVISLSPFMLWTASKCALPEIDYSLRAFESK